MRAYRKARAVLIATPAAGSAAEASFLPRIDRAVLTSTIRRLPALGCWTPHVEITRPAFEATLDVFQHAKLITKRHRYEDVVAPPPGLTPGVSPSRAGTSGEVPCLSGMKPVSVMEAAALPGTTPAARAAESITPARRWDPRLYQIATLAGLLGYGVFWLDLEVQARTAVAIVATALATQLACTVADRPGPVRFRGAR